MIICIRENDFTLTINLGQDVERLYKRYPNTPGRLIVQDLPRVVEEARGKLSSEIEFEVHDFFTPQPHQGTICRNGFRSVEQLVTL